MGKLTFKKKDKLCEIRFGSNLKKLHRDVRTSTLPRREHQTMPKLTILES